MNLLAAWFSLHVELAPFLVCNIQNSRDSTDNPVMHASSDGMGVDDPV